MEVAISLPRNYLLLGNIVFKREPHKLLH